MPVTVLYSERMYPDDAEERRIFGPEVDILRPEAASLAELPEADCARAEGLMLFRHWLRADDLARFPRLRAVVRMGVGYDRIDRAAAAARQVMVCNVPDYGTTEVADHAIALALALRRGIVLYHETQRAEPPAPWAPIAGELVRRLSVQGFGIVGLGRIGTAVALRAKALGFRVLFYDPDRPNGTELALGIERAPTLDDLLQQADVLSLHAPLTPDTRTMIGAAQLALLPRGAVVVNTARGPILDPVALLEALRGRFKSVVLHDGFTPASLDAVVRGINLGVVPVLWEDNLPQVAIELVSRGIPVLTSDRVGAREIARNEAFCFQAGSAASFHERLAAIQDGSIALAEFWRNEPALYSMEEHLADLLRYYRPASELAAVPARNAQ